MRARTTAQLAIHPDQALDRWRAQRAISSQWLGPTARAELARLGIRSPEYVQSFAYAPRMNVILVLNLKTGASTALKRLEFAEAAAGGLDSLAQETLDLTASQLWDPANRLTHPLVFSGREWKLADATGEWTATCRNPFSRYVSGFLHLSRVGVIPKRFNIDTFAGWCLRRMNRYANRHWMPQTTLLTPRILARLDHLLPVERMQSGSWGPPWFQTSATAMEHSNPNTGTAVLGLAPSTVANLRTLYADDFRLLGYSEDPQDAMAEPESVLR